ncbi:hypothetical protein [Amycolatopsis sp. cmx-11-51]|uniref:hypothetical protein n=1 Tax=unclassified Amycolatopsis TaxID=2618356 RepID=UPI0039E34647
MSLGVDLRSCSPADAAATYAGVGHHPAPVMDRLETLGGPTLPRALLSGRTGR